MNVELTKKDLISLVKGSSPHYDVFDNELVKKSGQYWGGHHDRWAWNYVALIHLSEEELYELYVICRDSWKKSL